MKDKLAEIMDYLKQKKVDYSDARFEESKTESITVKNGRLEGLSRAEDRGVGIRVLLDGCWGFAADSGLTMSSLKQTAQKAIRIAKASAVTKKDPARLSPVEIYKGKYETAITEDPFRVSLDEKIDLLLAVNKILKKHSKIKTVEASLDFFKTDKVFCSTEGAMIEQTIIGLSQLLALAAWAFVKR